MEQRPLRLGDILDDYCPRERRVTNHAIVAMIEEDVRQTRCTTCDAEHAYKGAKVPRRRKKDAPDALYQEVLAGMPEVDVPVLAAPVVVARGAEAEGDAPEVDDLEEADAPNQADAGLTAVAAGEGDAAPQDEMPLLVEEGPVHRPLIRATLPRTAEHKEVRQAPDFTMRQPIGRGNPRFRGAGDSRTRNRGGAGGGSGAGGNRPHGGSRFTGPRSNGGPGGFRSGPPRPGGPGGAGGGRKRSR